MSRVAVEDKNENWNGVWAEKFLNLLWDLLPQVSINKAMLSFIKKGIKLVSKLWADTLNMLLDKLFNRFLNSKWKGVLSDIENYNFLSIFLCKFENMAYSIQSAIMFEAIKNSMKFWGVAGKLFPYKSW